MARNSQARKSTDNETDEWPAMVAVVKLAEVSKSMGLFNATLIKAGGDLSSVGQMAAAQSDYFTAGLDALYRLLEAKE